MSFMLEKYLETQFTDWASTELRAIVYKIQGTGNKGNPDRLYLLPNGRHAMIEWKRVGAEPTKLQKLKHKRLRAHNQPIEVFDNAADAKQWLSAIASMGTTALPDGGV